MAVLLKRIGKASINGHEHCSEVRQIWGGKWDRRCTLGRFGLTEDSLYEWVTAAATIKESCLHSCSRMRSCEPAEAFDEEDWEMP